MQINVQSLGFELTPALRAHAVRRLQFALGWAETQVSRLSVRLSDINGPRGGEDKHCHLKILLSGVPPVVIEDTNLDIYVAINRAADRAGRTVARRLERSRDKRHGPCPPVATDGVSEDLPL